MPRYFVTWKMDIDADTPEEAAIKALRIHRDPESVATVFKVTQMGRKPVQVDINVGDDGKWQTEVIPFPPRT